MIEKVPSSPDGWVDASSENEPSGRVLIAIDGDGERDRIAMMLAEGGLDLGLARAASMDQVERLARLGGIDVALVSAILGNRSGLDAVDLLRHAHSGWAASAILIADRPDIGQAMEAVSRGFSDYLVRSALTPVVLVRAVGAALRHATFIRAVCRDPDALRVIDRIQRQMAEPCTAHQTDHQPGDVGQDAQPAVAGHSVWPGYSDQQLQEVADMARQIRRIRPNRPN
jgi:DNA-binding NarL/FixJ family response regulator